MRSFVRAFAVLSLSFSLGACGGSSTSSAPPARTAAQLDSGTYYAGMLLYAKEVSQLADGAVIGYRLTDSDGTRVVERIGVMTIDHVDADGLTYTWHTYGTDMKSKRDGGTVTLTTDGDGGDLDNDGERDLHYVSPPAPRDGLTDERYLKLAFHRAPKRAKRISFRIIDNGQSAPVVAARPILQFGHDGKMLLFDRELTVVNEYANKRVEYAAHPAVDLLRKDDLLIVDRRISLEQAQAAANAANRAYRTSPRLSKDGLGGVSNSWCCGIDDIISTVTTVVNTVGGVVVTAGDDIADEATQVWDGLSAFWGAIQNISYSGTPISLSGVTFRQGPPLLAGRAGGGGAAAFSDGAIDVAISLGLEMDLDVNISLDPITFATDLINSSPSFNAFGISTTWSPSVATTITFNNLTQEYSKEFHLPASASIPIGDTPLSLTPVIVGFQVDCTPTSGPMNGSLQFSNSASLTAGFESGSFTASGNTPPTQASQDALTDANGATCSVSIGPGTELTAAQIVHFPLTNWFSTAFTSGLYWTEVELQAGMSVGYKGVTVWDIDLGTIYSELLNMSSY
ncbi:MAG: hypothetical protein HQK87_00645 [Nitrospinae bacterium]|nr:hypothetical protein [Nitrospinota bacterium]